MSDLVEQLKRHEIPDEIERLTADLGNAKKQEAVYMDEVERLKEENEKLREIDIIQDGCHTRVCIGGSEALPLTIHKQPSDDLLVYTEGHHITDEDERWLPVYEWEGLYEVSDQGRVRSLGGGFSQKHGSGVCYQRTKYGKILSPGADGKGYMTVCLCREGREKTMRVHQLVLQAFVGLAPDGMECRHLDGTKDNNRLENLQWGTRKENAEDRLTHGTEIRGTDMHSAVLDEDAVIEIRRRVADGENRAAVGDRFGVVERTISAIISGQTWDWLKTCEGCGGSKNTQYGSDDNWRAVPCPDCNGRGWIKK